MLMNKAYRNYAALDISQLAPENYFHEDENAAEDNDIAESCESFSTGMIWMLMWMWMCVCSFSLYIFPALVPLLL